MPLNDFAVFVDQEGGIFVLRGAAPKPSARLLTAGLFGGFQGSFGVGTKVSARADDGSGHGVQKRYFGSFVFTSNTGISSDHLGNVRTVIDITTDLVSIRICENYYK